MLSSGLALRKEVCVGRGGDERWYDLVITPARDADGGIAGAECAAIDITDRREEKTWRLAAEEQLRMATLRASVPGCTTQTTDTLRWSERCREIFGVSGEAPVTYEQFLSLLHPGDWERTRRETEAAFRGEDEGVYAGENRVVRSDGDVRWVIARGQAFFRDHAGTREPVRFIGSVFDITDRKTTERACVG